MASKVLYAPVLDSYMPAFRYDDTNGCDIYFSLSKFNGSTDVEGIQIAVMKQGNGMTVVNPIDTVLYQDGKPVLTFDGNRQRSNGKIIIINQKDFQKSDDNFYHIKLTNEDIRNGQTKGWVYKIQLRLSQKQYDGVTDQNKQLNEHSSDFSEQSTVCAVKAIGNIGLQIGHPFNFDSNDSLDNTVNEESIKTYYDSTIDFSGRMTSDDESEKLYSYNLQVYDYKGGDDLDELIEDSGELFSNQQQNSNEFNYFIKKEFKDGKQYKIIFNFTTNNGYKSSQKDIFEISQAQSQAPVISVETAEYFAQEECHPHSEDYDTHLKDNPSSVYLDEEEGRMSLKLVDTEIIQRSGNYCIRRTDERSNFNDQIDIKIVVVIDDFISNLPIFYDYTIESGIYYKYAVQEIDRNGNRSLMNVMNIPKMRDFQYAYLLGEGGKQLKLKFDNTMQSFKIQQSESKLEPIGSKYPTITRNAAIEYKTFPIAGLISFQMDDAKTFYTKDDIYGDNAGYHKHYIDNTIETFPQYDYTWERDFRDRVLKFLYDGKPKLFKTSTEGNIIVRLMDINCTPNQTLSRMIYSFTSNANEIAEATMDNYLKYNFYEVGDWSDSFAKYEIKLGQISGDFNKNDNIIKMIQDKYSSGNASIAGYVKKIQKVYQIRITINDKPLRVQPTGGGNNTVIGNNIQFTTDNGSRTVTIFNGFYDFDSRVVFNETSSLKILNDAEDKISTVNANIDFLYEMSSEEDLGKKRENLKSLRGIGQLFGSFSKGISLYSIIKQKYYLNSDKEFCFLNRLQGIEIEARPGCEFEIVDLDDSDGDEPSTRLHKINDTGLLRLYDINDIKEIKIYSSNENHDIEDVIVTYYYSLLQGDYKDDD